MTRFVADFWNFVRDCDFCFTWSVGKLSIWHLAHTQCSSFGRGTAPTLCSVLFHTWKLTSQGPIGKCKKENPFVLFSQFCSRPVMFSVLKKELIRQVFLFQSQPNNQLIPKLFSCFFMHKISPSLSPFLSLYLKLLYSHSCNTEMLKFLYIPKRFHFLLFFLTVTSLCLAVLRQSICC